MYKNEIISIVEKYLNKKPNVVNIDVFHNEKDGSFNNDDTDINKLQYHIDDYHLIKKYNKIFCKLFIPLTNVDDNNGVTHIVRGSAVLSEDVKNKLDLISTTRFSDEYIEKKYNKEDIIKLNTSLGDIFLARTDGFHKGGFVKKGVRTILIVEYN